MALNRSPDPLLESHSDREAFGNDSDLVHQLQDLEEIVGWMGLGFLNELG